MEHVETHLAQNIERFRTANNMTVQQLATALGCSRTTVQRLEGQDASKVQLRFVLAAAEYFGVRVDRLIEQDLSDMDELEWAIHQLRRRLSKDERDSAIGIVEKSLNKRRMNGRAEIHESKLDA